MDYEKLGTTAVINAISKTNRLKAFLNTGDKEPSFDGHIYIYNNDSYSKDRIKKVAVQVKGKGVCSKPGSTIKYPVSVVDLDNYMRNGGVMFFVVYIDKNTGDTKRIYYASLLPFKIKELYLYASTVGGAVFIPVEYYSQIINVQMIYTDKIPVGVNGTVYYTSLERTITAEKIIFRIGSSFMISFPYLDTPTDGTAKLKIKVGIQLKGSLKQRIQALKFLIAMFEAKAFELDGAIFPINLSDAELKEIESSNFSEMLSGYERALAVLEKLNVKKDLPLDDFTEEDFWKLNSLIGAIENETPVRNAKGDLPGLVSLDFGGLHLAIICQKQDDGTYKLWDYFEKHIDIRATTEDGENFPASQYSVMRADDFLLLDNLRLQNVIDDFKRIDPQWFIVENGNFIMLEMLKAYDKEPKPQLFDAVKQMFAWLESMRQYLSDEVILINKLQIVRRERELTFPEKQELFKIISLYDNDINKIGAFILLNEQDEAERLLDEMPQKEKEKFMAFPIFKFYTKSKEGKGAVL